MIELAREMGVEVREERFTLDELKSADECFYTNSVREIVVVGKVDDTGIGNGRKREITMNLLERYREEAEGSAPVPA